MRVAINPNAFCTNLNGLNEACRVEWHGNNVRQTEEKKTHKTNHDHRCNPAYQ